MTTGRFKFSGIILVLAILLAATVYAVPPTKEAVEKWKAEGTYDQKIASWREFKVLGGCAPSEHSPFNKEKFRGNLAAGAATDTASLLVILVDFVDHVYSGNTYNQHTAGTPQNFDSILFSLQGGSPSNPTGSMTDFYLENSYGQFFVEGGITNWLRMDSTYVWHEGGANGIGSATSRSQALVLNAINEADAAGVNFQDYDWDNDGVIDGLVVIHAGHGAETGEFGIWSHKFHLAGGFGSVVRDGVIIYDYTLNPEEFGNTLSPIGVVCHEFGHTFGLPDLYDIDYDPPASEGLGRWSLMASGTYNLNGQRPAHFDAWCKDQIGFLNLINVTANMDSVAIPAVEYSPVAYKLQNVTSTPEYWIVENRQRYGSDFNLPGWGLLIYHVDPNAPTQNGSNDDPDRYLVGLEQADGNRDLETTLGNTGDAGDPYPGSSGNREFHDLSIPSDVVYKNPSLYPHIGVWDISASDSIMYADFDVDFSRPYIVLDSLRFDDALGNNDGNLDGGETIRVYVQTRNLMRTAYNATVSLSTPNSNVSYVTNDVVFASTFTSTTANNNSVPITFTLADSTPSVLDSFFITISCDSTVSGTPGMDNEYSRTFSIERSVGTPEILIVDDDRGDSYDATVTTDFSQNRIPSNIWHIVPDGLPGNAALQKYRHVFWFTGDSAANVIDTARINRFKSYMDSGGNLFLSTMSGIGNMHTLDSAFLNNYFKAVYTGPTTASDARGITGSTIGNGTRYRPAQVTPFDDLRQQMDLVSGGEAFLSWVFAQTEPYCGISYSNGYKSVLISFAYEAIQSPGGNFRPPDTLLTRVMAFFNDFATGIGDDPFDILPRSFALEQNYPNPFNPTTTISYTIHSRGSAPSPNRTRLDIFNLLGQKVRTLVDDIQSPGTYSVEWDGANDDGRKMATGIYFYRLTNGDQSQTKKMMMIK